MQSLLSEPRARELSLASWRYHAPTGFWWCLRFARKWRSHWTVLETLPLDDFRFIMNHPERAGTPSVPA